MDLREIGLRISGMDPEDVRMCVIITATAIFVLGLYLAKDYLAAQFGEPDRKVKISFKMMLGFTLMVAAVVIVILAPKAYERIRSLKWNESPVCLNEMDDR